MEDKNYSKLVQRATYASVICALIMVIIKSWAWLASGSIAILSSLIDSVTDILASFLTMIAVKYSVKPADQERRFGYGKLEAVAGFCQAIFIIISSSFLLFEALYKFIEGDKNLVINRWSIIVMLISVMLTLVLVIIQRMIIARTNSLAIKADSMHYMGDLLINVITLIAVILTYYSNIYIFDILLGSLVGIYLFIMGVRVGKISLTELIDTQLSGEDVKSLQEIISSNQEVLGIHNFKTRKAGPKFFIQFDAEINGEYTLNKAHDIAVELEVEIKKKYPNSEVMIHLDPYDSIHEVKHKTKFKI